MSKYRVISKFLVCFLLLIGANKLSVQAKPAHTRPAVSNYQPFDYPAEKLLNNLHDQASFANISSVSLRIVDGKNQNPNDAFHAAAIRYLSASNPAAKLPVAAFILLQKHLFKLLFPFHSYW